MRAAVASIYRQWKGAPKVTPVPKSLNESRRQRGCKARAGGQGEDLAPENDNKHQNNELQMVHRREKYFLLTNKQRTANESNHAYQMVKYL